MTNKYECKFKQELLNHQVNELLEENKTYRTLLKNVLNDEEE